MKAGLIAAVAALGLSACADGYGYAYDYDPYLGPRGHYTSRYATKRLPAPCPRTAYSGPYQDGYRGDYVAGPYCLDQAGQGWVAVAR